MTDLRKQSYIEANQYARAIYDGFYKLAGISFTFNAILFTGLSLIMSNRVSPRYLEMVPELATAFSFFGFLFNVGALTAYVAARRSWYKIHYLIAGIEADPHNEAHRVQSRIVRAAKWHGPIAGMTIACFGALIAFWLVIGVKFGVGVNWQNLPWNIWS